jgi:predicted LPLAT superfamily acyltransferase
VNWKQRPEGGGRFALWLIRSIALYGGRGVGRLLLYPITLYFLIRRGPERLASRAYLTRVLDRPASLFDVARHIHTFSCTLLDRVFLLSERFTRFDIEVHGLETLHAIMDQGRGALLLGSHHGSFESLRVLSQTRADVDVRVVLDKGQNPAITQLLDALNPDLARGVIDAGQSGTSIVLAIGEAAAQGALIGLLADRSRPGEPFIHCDFLGSPAPFPIAPMLIASSLHIPVVLCFGLYRGGRRYDLHFELFSEGLRIPRAERATALGELLQRYASRLEHHVRDAPYNWFNFYDFWQTAAEPEAGPAVRAADPAEPVVRARS